MHKNLIFYVCFFTLLIGTISADTITLISSDGKEFIIDENAAALSSNIAATLFGGEAFEEALAKTIHFNLIHSDYLAHIVKALEIAAPIYERPIASLSPNERKEYQKKVVAVLSTYFSKAQLSVHNLMHVLMTADFLDFPELVKSLLSVDIRQLSLHNIGPKALPILPDHLHKKFIPQIIGSGAFNFSSFYRDLSRHSDRVNSAHVSSDDKLVVTASNDNTAGIWDWITRTLIHSLRGHTDSVYSAQFSWDDKLIVTASRDGSAKIWDTHTGQLIRTLQGHNASINSALFSPDATKIVTTSSDQIAKIWQVQTGALMHTLAEHTRDIKSAQFSPNSTLIVAVSRDHTAQIWSAHTGQLIHTLAGHGSWVRSAQFSPDGTKIVTASADHTAKVWQVQTGALMHTLAGHTDDIQSAQFSPNNNLIITVSRDGSAKIWDAHTGQLMRTLAVDDIKITSAQFNSNNKLIVTGSSDGIIRIWDLHTGIVIYTIGGRFVSYGFAQLSPHDQFIVTKKSENVVIIWDLAPIKDFLDGKSTLEQILFAKMLSKKPKGQSFASLSRGVPSLSVASLKRIFKSFSIPTQRYFQQQYQFKIAERPLHGKKGAIYKHKHHKSRR